MRIQVALVAFSIVCDPSIASSASGAEARGGKLPEYVMQDYVIDPMPPGFRIMDTELEGPVFANDKGMTLYKWPRWSLRNGASGEGVGSDPACYDDVYRETVGYTSPYPGGNELPDADNRPTCVQHWPPVYASNDSKPVGDWTIVGRKDGTKQWVYKGQPLYTSHLDQLPGDTFGGSVRKGRDFASEGVPRHPIRPSPAMPPQFGVATMALGRLLTTERGQSIYTYAKDTATKSTCVSSCLEDWKPVLAPDVAVARGVWSFLMREDGGRQWVYRGKPVYTHVADREQRSYVGGDVPGWSNVFIQRAPAPSKNFQLVDARGGQVLADRNGKTIYFYQCNEDTVASLFCDTPDSPQEYRLAVCGAFDPARCLKTFPYVVAGKTEQSTSRAWGIIYIDPMTGRYAKTKDPQALRVWAFRNRPIYTFAGDRGPGDIVADGWGQDHGSRNGFTAFWIRSDSTDLDGAMARGRAE